MFSIEKFTNIIHEQLLSPLIIDSWGFDPLYSTNIKDFQPLFFKNSPKNYSLTAPGYMSGRCIWWHEEPLNYKDLTHIQYSDIYSPEIPDVTSAEYWIAPGPPEQPPGFGFNYECNFHLLANSELSPLKKNFLKQWKVYDWYFFFHGFAAQDWFRNYKYLTFNHYKLDKVFICLNHLITNNRSYRINFLSRLKEHNLYQFGYVSAPLLNKDSIRKEITDVNSRISVDSKKHILNHLARNVEPMILDVCDYNKSSADVCHDYIHCAIWNVVNETNFYDDKLHLTEKIFKPIITKRPFILVSAPGNLNYLRRYGFKTFDRWIDESYDDEQDHDKRIIMIVEQLKKLCSMPWADLLKMFDEMNEILEFNHKHFYGEFKEIISNELVDNFEACINQYNLHLSEFRRIPKHKIDFDKVKKLLAS
jgi:hypothetical protein